MKNLCLLMLLLTTLSTSNAQFSVNAGIGFNGLLDQEYRRLSGIGLVAGVEYEILKRFSIVIDGEYYFPSTHEFETFVRATSQSITPSFIDVNATNTLEMHQFSVGIKYNILRGPQGSWRLYSISGIGFGNAFLTYKIDDSNYDAENYEPDVDNFDPAISGAMDVLSHPMLIFGGRVETDLREGLSLIFETNLAVVQREEGLVIPGAPITPVPARWPNALRFALKVKKTFDFSKKKAVE